MQTFVSSPLVDLQIPLRAISRSAEHRRYDDDERNAHGGEQDYDPTARMGSEPARQQAHGSPAGATRTSPRSMLRVMLSYRAGDESIASILRT